jgi:hypothetical protein
MFDSADFDLARYAGITMARFVRRMANGLAAYA